MIFAMFYCCLIRLLTPTAAASHRLMLTLLLLFACFRRYADTALLFAYAGAVVAAAC